MDACEGCEWTLFAFVANIVKDTSTVRNFLTNHGILKESLNCGRCGAVCAVYDRTETCWMFACTKRVQGSGRQRRKRVSCGFNTSMRKGTFVGSTNLSPTKIVSFVALWLLIHAPRQRFIMDELECSSETVVDWSSHCRQVCLDWALTNSRSIGGPGVVVDINETKFGKHKISRGRRVEGQWVFGGIERGNTRNFFLIPVERRNEETLLDIISRNILPGTIIMSNCWSNLQRERYHHLRVEHSLEFVTSSPCKGVRRSISALDRNKERFAAYLAEHLFKKYHPRKDLLHHFFQEAALSFPPP